MIVSGGTVVTPERAGPGWLASTATPSSRSAPGGRRAARTSTSATGSWCPGSWTSTCTAAAAARSPTWTRRRPAGRSSYHRAHGTTTHAGQPGHRDPGRPAGRGADARPSWSADGEHRRDPPGGPVALRAPLRRARADPAARPRPGRAGRGCWPPAAGTVRMITIAPERAGALRGDPGDRRRRRGRRGRAHRHRPGRGAGRGRRRARRWPPTCSTRCRPIHHRDPGPVVALLNDPRVTTELIVDGTHVDPACTGWCTPRRGDTVALVTDAMAAAGAPDGRLPAGRPGRHRGRRGGPAGPQRVHRRQHRDHGPGVRDRGRRAAAAAARGPGRRGPAGGHHPGPRGRPDRRRRAGSRRCAPTWSCSTPT